MKISPNYSHKHICHFCHKNVATKDNEAYKNLYYIEKASHYSGVYHSVRYHKITVGIPRCQECDKIGITISRINLTIAIIIFFISVYIWSGLFAESDYNLTRSLEDILIACLPSFLIALFVGGAIAFINRLWLEIKWDYNDCNDYAPIKRLVSIGFEPRDSLPNIKNTKVQGKGPLEMNKLREIIASAITEDYCTFEK